MRRARLLSFIMPLLVSLGAQAQDPREALSACQRSCSQSCFELARILSRELGEFRQACGSAPREEQSSSAECIRAVRDRVTRMPRP